jgi:glutamyl-Q tRNA(Asp) synthetase
MSIQTAYIGRFAPSPTGPLHLGSLCTAVASYLDARSQGGHWLLRIENIDPPREQAGATEAIIQSLRTHGLNWDGDILEQRSRSAAYDAALDTLLKTGDAYYCSCSRRQLQERNGIHPKECIAPVDPQDAAIRLRVNDSSFSFDDRLQGPQRQPLAETGDFVLRRRDGLYAYQLAVVVDDIAQHINNIVRGIDLMDSTGRQLLLYERLQRPAPRFMHLPVLVDEHGDKLSKQAFAPAIDDQQAEPNLRRVLTLLNQAAPPTGLSCCDILDWASQRWNLDAIPDKSAIAV